MISIIILTKNEQLDLPNCLNAIKWSDDIHVLDSGSTDNTLEIAKSFGATISSNPFESFGKQRNYALDNLPIHYDWILFLDADEIITKELQQELITAINTAPEEVAGYYLCWKMILDGTWLKHCDNFPKWQFRLMRKGRARFTDFGHGQKEDLVTGRIEYIKEPYIHNGFSKGWHQWIDRHNRYSSHEAVARLNNLPPFKNIFASHSSLRNPALKSWLSRLPGWPILRFVQAYILNLGFLEGISGLIYCINMAFYEFMIQIKMREILRKKIVNTKEQGQFSLSN
ncbi:glycosyltransferase family 2 protein [Spirosoma sp. KCTC 42546]|uniref:glycosyltransferase family 2 protein n=1 Tax=Spirosoma sp. KCTC 42546 TaxID=2520506 RepID=UPI00115B76DB|nr:glycosyltransferase family 2 protein [Spirosoma sp. KCTC 42546]QDK78665.1 glycosyltransferase family 2 protein [Spirosoma sp. KCTC 42546]